MKQDNRMTPGPSRVGNPGAWDAERELSAWLRAAVDLLAQYRDYAEAMRAHGRGFYPVNRVCTDPDTDPGAGVGMHADYVENGARAVLARIHGEGR